MEDIDADEDDLAVEEERGTSDLGLLDTKIKRMSKIKNKTNLSSCIKLNSKYLLEDDPRSCLSR